VDDEALVLIFCGRNSPCLHHLWILEHAFLEIRVCILDIWVHVLEIWVLFLEIRVHVLEIRVCVSGNSGMGFWKFGYGFLDISVLISGYFAGWRTGPAGAGPRLDLDPDPVGAGRGRSGPVGELERT